MVYAREFFDLQFAFAERVQDLSGVPLQLALLEYTNLYVRFGFGRDFAVEHEGWQSYLTGLRDAGDGREWTYRCYLREAEARTAPAVAATFGCFSYALPDENRVRLHFRNTESREHSPLATARIEARRAELRALFADLEPRIRSDTPIVGASWLYNLRAYRRLFPPSYVATAEPIRGSFRSMPLWGQFLDRHGQIRTTAAASFRNALVRCAHLDDLDACFPLRALAVRAPASLFYEFHGV